MGMLYGRAKAETVITAIERPLNNTLLKLMAVEDDGVTRGRWIREAAVSIMEIEDIRLKPLDKPGDREFYRRILFDEPFGGVEERNVARKLVLLAEQYRLRSGIQAPAIADRLRAFHDRLAERCAAGKDIEAADYQQGVRGLLAGL